MLEPPSQIDAAVLLERRGHVAVITLNRPTAMNAVNTALSEALGDAVAELARDHRLRVGVVTGAGRAFCAGSDLKAVAAGQTVQDLTHPERGFAGFVRHFVDKPIVAAVNGFALGGGTEIVLACDMAVMSEEATLGLPEVRRGLVAAAGGMLRLHRQIPPKIAAEAAFTGEPLTAQAALRWGLVNQVVPADEVLETSLELAEKIARKRTPCPARQQADHDAKRLGVRLGDSHVGDERGRVPGGAGQQGRARGRHRLRREA